jgi:hypothetical protein
MSLMRLFNEPAGTEYLTGLGLDEEFVAGLPRLGISGIANLVGAVRFARYYELGPGDIVVTVLTDSMDMYASRLRELEEESGPLDATGAAVAHERYLLGPGGDQVAELTHEARRRIHNLKYFTWVEQQEKDVAELERQWDDPGYWEAVQGMAPEIDRLIGEFNERTGLQP